MPEIKLTPPYRPLLNDEAVEFLDSIVEPGFSVFEFGSGGSTVWFAEQGCIVYSVESDEDWYRAVKDTLNGLGLLANLDYTPASNNVESLEYAGRILEFGDQSFDLVFVDGNARPHCIVNALPRVKVGRWMVLDDLTYNPVRRALHLLDEGWEKVAQFRGIVHGAIDGNPRTNTTGFWRKL
jgi:predicted O-methyltransferase YrrM